MVTAAIKLGHLFLGRKAMTNQSRDITLTTKVCIIKAIVFLVVMYGYEIWTIKKAGHWRMDAYELSCWRRLLTARRLDSKEIKPVNPEGNQPWIVIGRTMLKLKLQYSGHLMWRANSLEKIPMLGENEGNRKKGQQRKRWLNSITDSMDMNLSDLREIVEDRGAWFAAVHGVPKNQTPLSNYPTMTKNNSYLLRMRWGQKWNNDSISIFITTCFATSLELKFLKMSITIQAHTKQALWWKMNDNRGDLTWESEAKKLLSEQSLKQ